MLSLRGAGAIARPPGPPGAAGRPGRNGLVAVIQDYDPDNARFRWPRGVEL
ncbi:MAG TPA: hypothetical protein VGF81_07210 [Solirubrobacteraceae bacterium]